MATKLTNSTNSSNPSYDNKTVTFKGVDGSVTIPASEATKGTIIKEAFDMAMVIDGTLYDFEVEMPKKIGDYEVKIANVKTIYNWNKNINKLKGKQIKTFDYSIFSMLHLSEYLGLGEIFGVLIDKTVALIEGKTPMEIRANLLIPDNVAPDYEEKIRSNLVYKL